MKLKEKWASLFIPKNTLYCHKTIKYIAKSNKVIAGPCKYWTYKFDNDYGYSREYCKYLKEFLSIQDQVKDCGINE